MMMMMMMSTYDVANVSGGDHDEEDDRPENLSPHRHVERVHVRTLGSFCFLMMSIILILSIMLSMMMMIMAFEKDPHFD